MPERLTAICRSCAGSGWMLVMRRGRPSFRRHGTCGGVGLRRAAGNRLGPAMYQAGRRALEDTTDDR